MERVIKNELDSGFAVVRPPGHHCERDRPMGFCLFNNIVVAMHVIKKRYKDMGTYQRFAIIDWSVTAKKKKSEKRGRKKEVDVHHGNGTQNLCWDDKDVLYLSIHRGDNGSFYPCTGFATDVGGHNNVVNIPLLREMGDKEYIQCFENVICPIVESFAPDMILISSGFDACIGDPLGGMNVTPPMYGRFVHYLYNNIAWKHGQVPGIVCLLEGGYDLETMPKAACCIIYSLLHKSFDEEQFLRDIKDAEDFNLWKQLIKTKKEHPRAAKYFEETLKELFDVHSGHFPLLAKTNKFKELSNREKSPNDIVVINSSQKVIKKNRITHVMNNYTKKSIKALQQK
ncbi:histone deacetylase hda1 [Reticulomyxa filosa]|uniref:histone deacetylase n=1 Tax=Reticulomyxa filosa TaxID=46433 RepID=X6NME6_RETFI|nr:histone deacetylase hda1 [Reticulomyxa filosa]|eukprot:ETO26572.1 histone deacetylase hda1 [Reticulomyxa filosa]